MIFIFISIIWTIKDPRPFKEQVSVYLNFKSWILPLTIILLQIFGNTFIPLPIPIIFVEIPGIIIFAVGAVIATWARLEMGRYWGMPAQHDLKRQNKLITTGPFRFSRNPIYLGIILMYLGFAIAMNTYLSISILLIYILIKNRIKKEEKLLLKSFGESYQKYKDSVPSLFYF